MPGSRLFCPDEVATRKAGVRLVTYDRAGTGRSDPPRSQPSLLDHTPDALALADNLGIDRFGLVGWSGGGCFAAALAFAAPERVTRLALVSSPGPLDEVPGAWSRLGDYMRPTAEVARRDPERARRAINRHMKRFLENPVSFLGSGTGPDGAVLRDDAHGPMLRSQITEGLSGGDGYALDLIAHWLPWNFALREIAVPTAVFHGARDTYGASDARAYAELIPNASLTVWPDDGHLAVVTHWSEVLAAVTLR